MEEEVQRRRMEEEVLRGEAQNGAAGRGEQETEDSVGHGQPEDHRAPGEDLRRSAVVGARSTFAAGEFQSSSSIIQLF